MTQCLLHHCQFQPSDSFIAGFPAGRQLVCTRQSKEWEIATDTRAIFNEANRAEVEVQLRKTVEKYEQNTFKLADWPEGNIAEGLTMFSF